MRDKIRAILFGAIMLMIALMSIKKIEQELIKDNNTTCYLDYKIIKE